MCPVNIFPLESCTPRAVFFKLASVAWRFSQSGRATGIGLSRLAQNINSPNCLAFLFTILSEEFVAKRRQFIPTDVFLYSHHLLSVTAPHWMTSWFDQDTPLEFWKWAGCPCLPQYHPQGNASVESLVRSRSPQSLGVPRLVPSPPARRLQCSDLWPNYYQLHFDLPDRVNIFIPSLKYKYSLLDGIHFF